MKLNIFVIIFLTASISFSQESPYSFGGYAKYLISYSKYPNNSNKYYDHLIHTRLNTKWYPSNSITGTMELRFRTFFGSSVEHIPNYSDQIKSYQPLMNLDVFLWNNKSSIGYLEADRIYFDYYAGKLQITLGRQRIAWGTSWVWNPLDIFNPKSVLDFDHEEFPGVDALRLQYYTGPVSKVELALAPSREKENSSYAILYSQNAFDYDFNFIAGIHHKRWIIGAGWSGDILEAGFRGEITYSEAPEKISESNNLYYLYGEIPMTFNNKNVLSFVLSGDYTLPNSFYIHTEILYNNIGKKQNAGLFYNEASKVGLLSPAKWSIYQEFSYDITPLLRGSVFAILNPIDKSFVFVPALSCSIITNLDLYLIGLFFQGSDRTEYGNLGNFLYARLKYSF